MDSNEERVKRNAKRRKILLAIILIIIALFVLVFAAALALRAISDSIHKKNEEKINEELKAPSLIFERIKPDENIFEDESYMAKDRNIRFRDAEVTIAIDENNLKLQTDEVKFMNEVIQYIINGKCDEYNALFLEEYFKIAKKDDLLNTLFVRESFTMQKLYNIELELINEEQTAIKDGTLNKYDFKLGYMIKNNNGTFRNDIEDEASRPVVYRIMKTTNERTGQVEIHIYDLLLNSKYEMGYTNN